MKWMNDLFAMATLSLLLFACDEDTQTVVEEEVEEEIIKVTDYTGTGAVSQGAASEITYANLYPDGKRVAALGVVLDADNKEWTVPADVNYLDDSFPFAPDLSGPTNKYNSAAEALAALDGSDVIEIDSEGDVITAYIFADNYFELYINGEAVAKDAIPFTDFNSHIVRFKVSRPFTIAMKLVDWEENLGLGSENQATPYHPGDGGMVAVFTDEDQRIIAVTNEDWKAQTYYIAPIQNLTCLTESGSARLSSSCSDADAQDGSDFYGVHWEVPTNWMDEGFDDSEWPSAVTYTNNTIGVDNKDSYTNFTDIFDATTNDAEFIWSSNVVLDNEVLVRYTVD